MDCLQRGARLKALLQPNKGMNILCTIRVRCLYHLFSRLAFVKDRVFLVCPGAYLSDSDWLQAYRDCVTCNWPRTLTLLRLDMSTDVRWTALDVCGSLYQTRSTQGCLHRRPWPSPMLHPMPISAPRARSIVSKRLRPLGTGHGFHEEREQTGNNDHMIPHVSTCVVFFSISFCMVLWGGHSMLSHVEPARPSGKTRKECIDVVLL